MQDDEQGHGVVGAGCRAHLAGATSGVLATKSLTTVLPVLPPVTGQDTITESWRLEATSQ